LSIEWTKRKEISYETDQPSIPSNLSGCRDCVIRCLGRSESNTTNRRRRVMKPSILLITLILVGCGSSDSLEEGFFCMQGTPEECSLVTHAEEAYRRCGVSPYRSEYYFFHKGDPECDEFHDKSCGYNMLGATVWIDQCKDICVNLPKYIVHEPLHEIWYEEPSVVEETRRILDECW